jgi:hypothetical protein
MSDHMSTGVAADPPVVRLVACLAALAAASMGLSVSSVLAIIGATLFGPR